MIAAVLTRNSTLYGFERSQAAKESGDSSEGCQERITRGPRHEREDVYKEIAQKTTDNDRVVPRRVGALGESPADAESGFEYPVDIRVPSFFRAMMPQMKIAA